MHFSYNEHLVLLFWEMIGIGSQRGRKLKIMHYNIMHISMKNKLFPETD